MRCHQIRRAAAHHLAAGIAPFGPEVDDPVGGADDIEVVFDDDQRVAGGNQFPECPQQFAHVVKMQAGRGLVEQEQRVAVADGVAAPVRGSGQKTRKLQPLCFAARQRRHRLAELEVIQADIDQRLQRADDIRRMVEKCQCVGHGQIKHVGDRFAFERDLEDLGAVASAVAVRAAQVYVGQELHFHMLKAVAAAGRAAAGAGIETESARGVSARLCQRRTGVTAAYRIEGADVACRIRARGAADRRLVDHHHVIDVAGTVE